MATEIYTLDETLFFPPPAQAQPDGMLAVGGDLAVPRLLLAYSQGIFPWYHTGLPILWWSPPKRALLDPKTIHISRSMRKILHQGIFEVRFDTNFQQVIKACAQTPRKTETGTWIVPEMQKAYLALHESGYAHSVEVYAANRLVGGLYGISLGGCFFGESMFSIVSNASKVALLTLAQYVQKWDFDFIDCQMMNEHLAQFGTYEVPRETYLQRLAQSLQKPTRRGLWHFAKEQ